jgi:hypothetical protein
MDKLLLRGEQLNTVAHRYSVSEDALGRHKRHMQLVIAKASAVGDQKDVAYGSTLISEIGRIRADAERLQLESERRQDVRGGLRAIHERLAIVELEAKLNGQIESGQRNVTINVQSITPDEAIGYARDILELFLPAAQPQPQLPTALLVGETDIPSTEFIDGN